MPKNVNADIDPILISFYSHKGGVGKTTSVHNIAYILSKLMGYKVLLVDADPQCSLSALVLRKFMLEQQKLASQQDQSNNDNEENNFEILDDRIHQYIDQKCSKQNIYKFFDVLCEQKYTDNPHATLQESVEKIELIKPDSDNENLSFLVGNNNFYKLERTLITALTSSAQYPLYSGLQASPSYYLRELAKYNGAEIILIDLNPGSTILNASLLLGSDYFTVPIMPDHFSRQAIWSLSNIIPDWEEKFISANSRSTDNTITCRKLPSNPPHFLGIIPGRVKSHKDKPVKAYGAWLNNIYLEIEQSLYPHLKKYKMASDTLLKFPSYFIPKINASIVTAQRLGLPLVAMKDNDYTKAVKADYVKILFSLFSNLKREHHTRLKINDKFRSIDFIPHKHLKNSLKYKEIEQGNLAQESFHFPLPIPQDKLVNYLFSQKDSLEFRKAVALEVMDMELSYLGKSLLSQNDTIQKYVAETLMITSEVELILNSVIDDLYNKKFNKLKKVAKQLPEKLFDDKIDGVIDSLKAFITSANSCIKKNESTSKKRALKDESDNEMDEDSLENQIDKLSQYILTITKHKDNLEIIQNECLDTLSQTAFYEFYVLKWLSMDEAFLSFEEYDQQSLIIVILNALKIDVIIRDLEENDETYDIYLTNNRKDFEYLLKKSDHGFTYHEENQHQFSIADVVDENLINLNSIKDYDHLQDYRQRWITPSAQENNLPDPIVISLFNHKGGVAKTTSCQNIAHMIGESGKKVLLIDTDTQCNLSSLIMGSDYNHYYYEQRNVDSQKEYKQSYALLNEIVVKGNTVDPKKVSVYKTRFDNVFLLPGSTMRFVEVEFSISSLFQGKNPRDWGHLESAAKLFKNIGKAFEIDVIIIDMCPSISSTNQMILLHSNYFIIPYLTDYLSLQSVKSLAGIISEWAINLYDFALAKDLDLDDINLPQLLQLIPQRYGYTKNYEPSAVHKYYITKTIEYIKKHFKKDLIKIESNISNSSINKKSNASEIIELITNALKSICDIKFTSVKGIPDYGIFGLRAQESHSPICSTPYKNFAIDRMSKSRYQEKLDLFRGRYLEIVKDIMIKTDLGPLPATMAIPSPKSPSGSAALLSQFSAISSKSKRESESPDGDSAPKRRRQSAAISYDVSDLIDDMEQDGDDDAEKPQISYDVSDLNGI